MYFPLKDKNDIFRKVADVLTGFCEPDLFLRGAVYWAGFHSYALDFTPDERYWGKTKYSFRKMVRLALQGATSFSVKPLYAAIVLRFVFVLIASVYFVYVVSCVIVGKAIPGWASTIIFLGDEETRRIKN